MEAFRSFLDDWLARAGWSAAQLSRESGIRENVISRWLSQKPTRPAPASLQRLAPVLGVAYEDLLKLAGYLPGEANLCSSLDPELAAATAAMHAGWPRWDAGFRRAVLTLISTSVVYFVQTPATPRLAESTA